MLKTPPMQSATNAIDVLCGRLRSSTLLEDRRVAIVSLRSFAKQYPASVASGSLRELVSTLRRDGLGETSSSDRSGGRRRSEDSGDVDTVRLVLETLQMLFNPDSNSPEASDEIAYFLADEFVMREDNLNLLLSLLDPESPVADYYARLYSVQLLQAICAARPDRLQESILHVPLGISRLVGVLDDVKDAVRNAGLLLLVDLTIGASEDLRKIVAFEDVFARIFNLIASEGGLGEAGITAQDALSLLNNLLASSASNRIMFRESGGVTQMAQLLQQAFPPAEDEVEYLRQGRERAAWGLLQLMSSFFEPGATGTPQNQLAFFRVGLAQILLDLGFSAEFPTAIRALALKNVTAMIASNAALQEAVATLTVEAPATHETNGTDTGKKPRAYLIEALLDLSLDSSLGTDPSLRTAACHLIQAYLGNHERIKEHFLTRAISGHEQHEKASNVVSILLQSDVDPSSSRFASWIISDLIYGNTQAKAAFAALKEGEGGEEEDILSSTQTIGSYLASSLQSSDISQVAAYGSVLVILLWDYTDGVNDLLSEGSALINALVGTVDTSKDPFLAGISAALLGTIYEFSTKDSPIPRRKIASILREKVTSPKYMQSILSFRRHPSIRDHALYSITQPQDDLFPTTFIDLFTIEIRRLTKAIDKDPGIEVIPFSHQTSGVDRDILDELRQQLQTKDETLTQRNRELSERDQTILLLEQQREQDRTASTKDLQAANAAAERLTKINQSLQSTHQAETEEVVAKHKEALDQLRRRQELEVKRLENANLAAVEKVQREADRRISEQAAISTLKGQEYEKRLAEMGNALRAEQSRHKEAAGRLEEVTARYEEIDASAKAAEGSLSEMKIRCEVCEREVGRLRRENEVLKEEVERGKVEEGNKLEEVGKLRGLVEELRREIKGREEELKAEREGYNELEGELESVKGKLQAALEKGKENNGGKGEIEKVKKEAKEAKEELEAMLLVMGELESKRDEYKEKVKKLGGEVTDEEDEESEEE